jgi:hypothetical protein
MSQSFINETGTLSRVPPKGPERATDGDWHEPNTMPKTDDKSKKSQGSANNVGKDAGKLNGKKGGSAKIW